jgi:hypothetical protein
MRAATGMQGQNSALAGQAPAHPLSIAIFRGTGKRTLKTLLRLKPSNIDQARVETLCALMKPSSSS